MIFVLEQYLKNRQIKIKAWEKARDEWVYGGAFRDYSDYEREHPYPALRWSKIAPVFYVFGAAHFVGLLVFLAVTNAPPPDPNNPHGCSVVIHKGDNVGVTGGDFQGSKGVAIDQRDDCSVHLTLAQSTYTFDLCNKKNPGNCNDSKENGAILTVDRSSLIVKL